MFAETRAARPKTAPRPCRWSTSRCLSLPIRSPRRRTRCSCGRIARARPTTSITGRSATGSGTARALDASAKRVEPADLVPALPSGAARAVRVRRALRRDGAAAVPRHVAGPARLPDGARDRHRHPEDKIHVVSPDIGGGFGNKVPVYPGYVCAIVGALKIGRPVKWIESRTENLTSDGVRARLPHGRRARRRAGRHGSPRCASPRPPTTARSTPQRIPRSTRPACSAS